MVHIWHDDLPSLICVLSWPHSKAVDPTPCAAPPHLPCIGGLAAAMLWHRVRHCRLRCGCRYVRVDGGHVTCIRRMLLHVSPMRVC